MYRGYEDLELIGFEDEAHILSEGKRNRNVNKRKQRGSCRILRGRFGTSN